MQQTIYWLTENLIHSYFGDLFENKQNIFEIKMMKKYSFTTNQQKYNELNKQKNQKNLTLRIFRSSFSRIWGPDRSRWNMSSFPETFNSRDSASRDVCWTFKPDSEVNEVRKTPATQRGWGMKELMDTSWSLLMITEGSENANVPKQDNFKTKFINI